jgi:hypothetical protein
VSPTPARWWPTISSSSCLSSSSCSRPRRTDRNDNNPPTVGPTTGRRVSSCRRSKRPDGNRCWVRSSRSGTCSSFWTGRRATFRTRGLTSGPGLSSCRSNCLLRTRAVGSGGWTSVVPVTPSLFFGRFKFWILANGRGLTSFCVLRLFLNLRPLKHKC